MKIKKELLENIVTDKMGEYSTYVLLSRAIPDIRDGLKPSYRRILWTMKEMGATKFTKSANIAGKVMEYHPHGSTYPTMVGMTQTDAQLNPYLTGKGNFGSHASELSYASERYTDLKLSEISLDIMADSKKNGIELIDNYDGTKKIPEVFPVRFPSILAYAQSGIGVGFSSSIPSFNLAELCKATIKYIETTEKTMLIPDFGTKAYVINDKEVIKSINNEGKGSIYQRAKVTVDGNKIVITEIPYNTTKEKITNRIVKLYKEGRLNEIRNIEDLSGLKGMRIVVTAKKNVDMELLLEKLYQNTPMQTSYSSNMMIVNTDGLPELKGVWGIIDEWVEWRREVIVKMLTHDNKIKEKQIEVLKGLDSIKDDLDKVIDVIRKSTDDNVISNLSKEFSLTKMQSERIAGLKLRNLTTTFIKEQIQKITKIENEVKKNKKRIDSEKKQNKMIVKDLEDIIKNFGKERQSAIIDKSIIEEKQEIVSDELEIEDYNIRIFVTSEGYLKKIPLTSLRGNFNIRVKDEDEIINECDTVNNSEILIFTDKQNVYKLKSYEIENHKPSDLGEYLPTLLQLKDEEILYITVTDDFSGDLLIGFDDGRVARIDMKAYETKQNRAVLRNAYADKNAIYWNVIHEDIDLLCISSVDKALIINTSVINSKSSRTVQGNIIMRSKDDSLVRLYQSIITSENESLEYYRLKNAGTGKYLRKGDSF